MGPRSLLIFASRLRVVNTRIAVPAAESTHKNASIVYFSLKFQCPLRKDSKFVRKSELRGSSWLHPGCGN